MQPTKVLANKEYLTRKHKVGGRSVVTKTLQAGSISDRVACMIWSGNHATIFNYSVPYDRHYIDGVETDTPLFTKGESFSGVDYYGEGREHSYQDLLFKMGYYDGLGIKLWVRNNNGMCENDGVSPCAIRTTHTARIENYSGDVGYVWEVSGATIESGQGTSSIVVETIDIDSVDVTVKCTVTDTYSSAVVEEDMVHTRITYRPILVPRIYLFPSSTLTPTGE